MGSRYSTTCGAAVSRNVRVTYMPLNAQVLRPKPLTLFLVLLVLMGFNGSQVLGQSQRPAPGQSFSLDLDSAEGTYSQWRHEDLSSLTRVHATATVLRLRNDPK